MSWNPSPMYGGANWQGSQLLATKNQLLSTSSGLYEDLKDFSFSTISISSLNVLNYISTPLIYVSDIKGYNVELSGNLITQDVSANQSFFNITNVSVMKLEFKPTFTGDVKVTFDLGLGQALGGLLAGLGAAVGGALIGVGTATGLAIQGAEQGIGTIIAGRPANYINNSYYETLNFGTQLQISTLGDAFPAYSTVFRTVSSVSANQVPGREIFTSSIFYPGQICIRSVSDPFQLVTGDSNVNTSTIQSFGEWVPMSGLEPEDIFANSISTNFISAGQTYSGLLASPEAYFQDVNVYNSLNILNEAPVNLNYNAPLNIDLGSSGDAKIFGYINQFNFQSDQPIVFNKLVDPGTTAPSAQLVLGDGNESILTVSSIEAFGDIKANSGYFSTLTVNELIVISSFSTIFTIEAISILSTGIVTADLVSTNNLKAKYVAPFAFSSVVGNPYGTFDITKNDTFVSTLYDSVSSLTQNVLNYSLNIQVQDQATFDIPNYYQVSPANVQQWASTFLIRGTTGGNPANLAIPYSTIWLTSPVQSATFDLLVDQTKGEYFFNCTQAEVANNSKFSTFLSIAPTPGFSNTYRFSLNPNGWWTYQTPVPSPYITSNNNTFQIYQDINDTYIQGTDRLHLKAGDIYLDGNANFGEIGALVVGDIFTSNITAQNSSNINGYFSTIYGSTINATTVTVDPVNGGFNSYYFKSTISYNLPPTTVTPVNLTFKNDSPNFGPQFSLIPNFMGANYFTSYNHTSWNNSIWTNNSASQFKPNIYCGDLQAPLGPYAAFFYINNAPALYALPVYYINSSGVTLLGNVTGGDYAKVETANGVTWTITTGIPNPSGSGGSYSNVLTVDQNTQYTQVTNNQNLQIQAPNTTITTGTLGLFADQIRVNSHTYGFYASAGLPSYPIGIENTVYMDNGMVFTQYGITGVWYSDATNVVYNITGQVYYDANSWIIQVIPSRFRFPATCAVYGWDVQPVLVPIGGGGYAWAYSRYITVSPNPSNTADNWNWIIAFPKNYCTY